MDRRRIGRVSRLIHRASTKLDGNAADVLISSHVLDLHNHVIFGIDDGCRTLEESAALSAEAKAAGHVGFVATPHIRPGMFDNDPASIRAARDVVRETVEAAGLELHLGAEYYFDINLLEAARDHGLLTLGETSRYVLVEFPSRRLPLRYDEILYEISVAGYVPVIAHPERCADIQERPAEALGGLQAVGALLQLDLGSLVGHYGRAAKKAGHELVKRGAYNVAAADLHRPADVKTIVPPALKVLTKLLKKRGGESAVDTLISENPRKIIENIEPYEIQSV